MSDLHDKVRRTIEEFGLLRAGNTVVVAVSGGADSVALLHLLADLRDEYALVLHVAHLNHRLRPDACADAEFVRQTATNLGIPITVEEVDVSARAAVQKRSLEDAGRQARYEFFAREAGALGAGHLQTRGLLSEAGRLAGAADKFFEEMATVVLGQAHREGQTIQFPLGALRDLPQDVRQRVIRLAASEVSGTEVTPHDVVAIRGDDVATGRVGREVRLERCVVRRGYQSVEVSLGTPAVSREYRLMVPGEVEAGDFGVAISAEVLDRSSLPAMIDGRSGEVYLDASVVGSELVIRPWQKGDKISPLGLRGTKKVHDIFVDGKIPRWERAHVPLVADADGRILWVVGLAIADSAKVTVASTKVVRLRARGLYEVGRIAGAMAAGVHKESRRLQT